MLKCIICNTKHNRRSKFCSMKCYQKNYHQQNREKIANYQKEYQKRNREKMLMLRETCTCPQCFKEITKGSGVIHINIYNKPIESYFCSKKCKNDWIYGITEVNPL